jgi:hypothetical protein
MTAGIDLALALIEEDLGLEAARTVARKLVLYHRRTGGQSSSPCARASGSSRCQTDVGASVQDSASSVSWMDTFPRDWRRITCGGWP